MKKLITLLLLLLMLSGCGSSFTPKATDQLTVILHAGGGYDGLTHLNAQETFAYYYDRGYRYFEYDLRLSNDGRIIATHAWEHLQPEDPCDISYEEFMQLRLSNGFTPANEEWLMETIRRHPDVTFVIDAKMDTTEGDAAVLARLEALEEIYDMDISANILPEIFSREMWELAKEQTSFDRYFFSHYKVYYTAKQMLEYFSDDRIWGFALPTYTDGSIRSHMGEVKQTKQVFVFTPTTIEEVEDAAAMGADGVYLDFPDLIK